MSSDNGIYILKTPRRKIFEYRIRHMQAVENYMWNDEVVNEVGVKGAYTDDQDVWIQNAREMWEGCKVFTSERQAMAEAMKIYQEIMNDDLPICEYGIQVIEIDREF